MNAIGYGSASEIVEIHAASVPDAPNAPTLVSQSSTAISIQWSELATSRNGGSPVLDYKLYWDDPMTLAGYVVLASSTTPHLQFTVEDLTAGHEYRF